MKEFEELQQLWHQHIPDSKVSFETVMQRIDVTKRGLATNMWWHMIAFGIALLVLLYIWLTVYFVTWTSYLALLMVAVCMIYGLLSQWRSYRDIQRMSLSSTDRPEVFLGYLREFQANRHRQHTRSFIIYETCIAAAFALYSLELYFALSLGVFIGLIFFVVFWFIFSHFVFLKAYINHENEKIQLMIEELDRIKNQFD